MRVDRHKILTKDEFALVLSDLRRKARRAPNTRVDLIILLLSARCGLRVAEIRHLDWADVRVGSKRPTIAVRKGKGLKSRRVPLHWDQGTLTDLAEWKHERQSHGAKANDPFVCSLVKGYWGGRLSLRALQYRWRSAIKIIGEERVEELSIHCGRHSFVSHSLAGGRSLAEVRDAAGDSNISTTNIYTHLVDDDEEIGSLFDFSTD